MVVETEMGKALGEHGRRAVRGDSESGDTKAKQRIEVLVVAVVGEIKVEIEVVCLWWLWR